MSGSLAKPLGIAAALAALATPSHAWLHSQSTQGQQIRHDVRILDHVVRTTVHEGWADVEEELSLGTQASADSWNSIPTDNQNSWEIAGQFSLPEGSVVTGALLWNGNTLLKAKLKGASQASGEYENVVDRQTAPRPMPIDPLLIEKIGDNYSMKLYPVQWNGARRMRIRYMVPLQSVGDGWKIPVGSAFAQEVAGHAEQYEIDLVNEGGPALKIEHDGMLMPIGTSTKLVDYPPTQGATSWWEPPPSYHSPFSVVLPQKGSVALATSMDSGAWKGGYVVYKGKLPDTLLSKSNIRQELLVLWKWNNTSSFVQDYGWGNGKELSSYGNEVLNQANTLASSTTDLARSSDLVRIGLVSDEGDSRKIRKFGLSKWGSDTFALMQEYLGGFNQDTILNRYTPNSGTGNGNTNGAKDRKEGAKRFAADLQIAFSLYSADSGVVRHIVFVSAGPASDLPDPTIALPVWPIGLTASSYSSYNFWETSNNGAHWPGVDLPALVDQHALAANRQFNGPYPFTLPLTRVTWNLEFSAGTRNFSVDAVTGIENSASASTSIEFNGHAKAAWSKNLSWKLYDENGNLVRSTSEPASNWIELPNDSSVARLWGGSSRHWSENWRTRSVGNIFGFVDASHSLLALPSDSIGLKLQDGLRESGVPFLLASEIFGGDLSGTDSVPPTDPLDPPITSVASKGNIAGFAVRTLIGGHGLTIALPQGLDASRELVVRDIHGRILARWNASQLASLKTIDWNAPSGAARGMLFVELRSGSVRTVKSASIL